jgi:hypothetical protein
MASEHGAGAAESRWENGSDPNGAELGADFVFSLNSADEVPRR